MTPLVLLSDKEFASLLAVIDYLILDMKEERHYEESGKPKKHIYLDAKRLQRYSMRQILMRQILQTGLK